ncbi:uncharacterized protein [Misgurnus anguillicaudatus]|uniref:uncharacterized protein n=1 Tax=Misgurnus anguillicaudatus TaxID=75329 RepID=UPI003CCF9521
MQDGKMKFTLSIVLIYSIWCKSVQTQGIRSFEGGGDDLSQVTCCLMVSNTKTPIVNLLDYYVQDSSLCSIRAIRFRTRKNKTICSDPEDKWAKKAMKELNAKRAVEPSKKTVECQTSQSKLIPTPLTTFISKANDNSVAVTAVMITTSPTKRIKQLPKRRRGKSGKGKSLRRYQYQYKKMLIKNRSNTLISSCPWLRCLWAYMTEKSDQKGWLMSVVIAASDGPSPNCCLTVSGTKTEIGNLLDYYIQDSSLCPIKAIRFRTKKNKTICSDPEDKWAKKAKAELDKRRLTTTTPYTDPPMCNTKISTDIPAISTTIPTTGPKTEISTSTVTSKNIKSTTIKTARPETVISTSTATSVSTAPSTVTTFKTTSTSLQTEIRTTTTKPTTVSRKSLKSNANPCSVTPKRTIRTTTAPPTTVTTTTQDRPKLKTIKPRKRKHRKSKPGLRKIQMRLHEWNKATTPKNN